MKTISFDTENLFTHIHHAFLKGYTEMVLNLELKIDVWETGTPNHSFTSLAIVISDIFPIIEKDNETVVLYVTGDNLQPSPLIKEWNLLNKGKENWIESMKRLLSDLEDKLITQVKTSKYSLGKSKAQTTTTVSITECKLRKSTCFYSLHPEKGTYYSSLSL
jgi:hypothetical protein